MGFDAADYRRAAQALDVPAAHIMALVAVEASGETFWDIDGEMLVPVRHEAHWFGKLTAYRFNKSHPDLSCFNWTPELAAKTRAGAWDQVRRAAALDLQAAYESTSWGGPQVMGFHWKRLGYLSVEEFVGSMSSKGDDGQMDAFARFVDADDILQFALRTGDWDTVEIRYNGGGYGGAYAEKMRQAVKLYADPSAANAAPAPRPLRIGQRGADVVVLQRALGIVADGDFGQATHTAVRLFQETHGLVVDGIAGTMTCRALGIAI